MAEWTPVTDRFSTRGPLSVLNLVVLAAAYVALFTRLSGASKSYVFAVAAGGAVVAIVTLVILSDRARAAWLDVRSRVHPAVRAALAVVPWLGLFAWIVTHGLWWTQRPPALRFFGTYALANWSVGWCLEAAGRGGPATAARRPVIVLAALLAALGIEGLAFGVTPFGCAASAFLAGTASFAFAVASFGSGPSCLKLFAASAATLLAVAAVETTVRLRHIGQNVQEVDSREHAREFYTLTPPRSAFVNSPNVLDEFGPALIEINTLGIRGPEIPDERADVLLIGDSMIEARQLPWERTLGPLLQEAFRARSIPDRVVSHGMRGWSPLLEWNWYLKVGRRLRPRTVMLFFFWNDLWTAGDEAATFRAALRPDGRPDHFDVLVESDWIWYKHVRLMRLSEEVWHRLSVTQMRRAFSTMAARKMSPVALDMASAQRLARTLAEPALTAAELDAILTQKEEDLEPRLRSVARRSLWPSLRPWRVWTAEQRTAAAKTELELQRFAEDVAADGGRLAIVFVPNPLQIGSDECAVGRLFERVETDAVLPPDSGIQTWLQGVAERHHVELLDPSDVMREHVRSRPADDSAPLYLRADCHWSERGHQFMADYLADWYTRTRRAAVEKP
jgi:hypothetical protein